MEESREEFSSQIRQLFLAVDDIQRRIAVLERAAALPPPKKDSEEADAAASVAVFQADAAVHLKVNPAPLVGWALLGLSGAYLLRGMTESGVIPALAGVVAGVIYSASWLFVAARRAWESALASTIHSATSALIIAPLVWEAVARFHLMSAPVATALLVAFTVFGLGIAWRHRIGGVAWVTTLTGLLAAFAVFRLTHHGPAWAFGVLAIATAVEVSACRDRWLGLRWITAGLADLTVLTLTMLATRAIGGQSGAVLSPAGTLVVQICLLTIYLASTADRTLIRKLPISGFEIGQAAAAFLVAVGGSLYLADVTTVSRTAVGLFCLLFSVACYVVSFTMLDRDDGQNRNFYTYSSFGILLMTTACSVLLPGSAAAIGFSVLTVCLIFAGALTGRRTLRVHAVVFLVLASFGANVAGEALGWLIQPVAREIAFLGIPYLAVVTAALVSYWGMFVLNRCNRLHWKDEVEATVTAALALWASAGLAAYSVSLLLGRASPVRTAVLTLLAGAAGWSGAHWHRRELKWVAYSLVAGAGLKLLYEDFRHAEALSVFVSLILFGAMLVLLPRLTAGGHGHVEESSPMAAAKRAGR